MRRLLPITMAVVAILAAGWLIVPKVLLHLEKARISKENADGRWMLNAVPQAVVRKIQQAAESTNTIWLGVDGSAVGFPADRFERDPNPKRAEVMLHHLRYRVLAGGGAAANSKQFASVMQPFMFTNLYEFVASAFRATEVDVARQSDMKSLLRHSILLKTKMLMAPLGFEDSCIEFDRGDFRGFITGDPSRSRNLYVMVYAANEEQFISLGIIPKQRIQMSEVEELVAGLKLRSNPGGAANLSRPVGSETNQTSTAAGSGG